MASQPDYRELLLQRRKVLSADARGLEDGACGEKAAPLSSTTSTTAEQATDSAERDVSLGRMESQDVEIREIDDALERFRQGSFGICEDCGGRLPADRLEAIPYARRCLTCQLSQEAASEGA